jgi:hypothetical protein
MKNFNEQPIYIKIMLAYVAVATLCVIFGGLIF